MAEENVFINLVYCGERETVDGKLAYRFLAPDGVFRTYTPKKRMHWSIGRTYVFETVSDESTSVYLNDSKLDQSVPPHDDAERWKLEAQQALRSIDACAAARRMERTAKEDNKDFRDLTLGEVRQMVSASRSKAAIITAVMDFIRPY